MELNSEQLRVLRHMLGIDDPDAREPKPYRNYYAACPGDPAMAALAKTGAVRLARGPVEGFPYDYYVCTDAGTTAAIKSHRAIRKSKSQRVYSAFLSACDCFQDLTFRQFLTDPYFAETRRSA